MKPPRRPACTPPETFPAIIANRPSLDRIAYRIGGYVDVRRWLLRRIDEDPMFAAWTYRGADDPGIALYEAAAILVDLLGLYQEAYANEAFLRTARWRDSVADLVRLLGYRLKPGIAGTGAFAFEVRGTAPVAIPAGFPLKADLVEAPAPATFQTRAAAEALPWLSRFALVRPQRAGWISAGTRTLVVEGAAQAFAKHDRLLVGVVTDGTTADPRTLDPWEIAIVDSVESWHGRTVLRLQGALGQLRGSHATLTAFKLGRTFRHFGHNAPPQRIEVRSDGSTIGHVVGFARSLDRDDFTGGTGAAGFPPLARDELPLDPQVHDLAAGTRLAIQLSIRRWLGRRAPARTLSLARIAETRAVTCAYGALSSPATIATLERPLAPLAHPPGPASSPLAELTRVVDLREIQIDTVLGEPFAVGAACHDLPLDRGARLAWWGDPARARDLLHRAIAVVPVGAPSYEATVVAVEPTEVPDLVAITLDREVDYAAFSEGAGTLVFGNLVEATEGKQEPTLVLGNGDERATFQTFLVPKGPLTYANHPALTPPERPELEVVVAGRIWQCVPSLYGRGAAEEIYVVRQDHEGRSWVQFGDGKTGARLPSGIENVAIRWRTGAGAFGPTRPGAQVAPGARIDAITAVTLPGVIAGGSAPEAAEVARVAAPRRVQSLDRLVSFADIEAEALSIGGVEKARAAWAIAEGVPMVQVTISMQARRAAELEDVRRILATANRERGPHRFPIQVVAGGFEYVYLDLVVAIDPAFEPAAVRAAVQAALGVTGSEAGGIDGAAGLFGTASPREFGDPEYATRVEGTAQNVRGVRWAAVHAFGSLGTTDDPAQLRYPSSVSSPAPARAELVACPPTRVLRLFHAADGGPLVLRIVPGGTAP
ncbi:MAG: hypothetical protein ACTHU0_11225 [Kofleriaceae bacterium]